MPASVHVEDGDGTGRKQHVTSGGEALVTSTGCPPLLQQRCRVFRGYLEDSAGSNDMDVAGTVNAPHDFYVSANEDVDRYITMINFYAGYGATGELFEWFDRGGALPNGCRLYYETQADPVYIRDAILTNSDLLRLCVTDIMRSDWESRNFAALNDYGFISTVNLLQMMPPYGVKLDRGTTQRLVFAIRDDITAETDAFNAVCYGFDRVE